MRFVPVKTAEQQAALMLVALRDRLIRSRTQLTNAIRGHAAEFGLIAAAAWTRSIRCWRASPTMRAFRRWRARCLPIWMRSIAQTQGQLKQVEHGADGLASPQRTSSTPDADPRRRPDRCHPATLKTPDPSGFRSAPPFCRLDRSYAKGPFDGWQDPPRDDHARRRRGLRSVLVVGATALIRQVRRRPRAALAVAAATC